MSTEAGPAGNWEPRILAFVCRWCTYAGADLAGTSRLKYPPNIRIIKLPCSGRIDPLFLLRGFESGADGILVSGCHPGDCHYTSGNYYARRRWVLFRELLDMVGLEPERLHFSWVSAAEGGKFVEIVKKVTEAVRSVGPFPGFAAAEPGKGGAGSERGAAGAGSGNGFDRKVDSSDTAGAGIDASLLRKDLESGTVRAILGRRAGRRPGALQPVWAKNAAAVDLLRYAPEAQPNLAGYLVRKLREQPDGAYGIVAGPREAEALELLIEEKQVDPERVHIYRPSKEPARTRETAAAAMAAHAVPGLDRPARERWDYWNAQFGKCLRCYACREACPLCSCVRCVQDKTRPRWIDSSPSPAGNWVWNVTRAFHQAGRCVDCGACTEGCPAGIPLEALNRHMREAAERAFGAATGEQRRSPLLRYDLHDEAPFIL